MPRNVTSMIQADADTLWWSREPQLGAEDRPRFRRFVARRTAIGPRSKGGLGNLDWAAHVESFQSQWITRYVDPCEASWKTLLDTLLLHTRSGEAKYPAEGRGILFCNLNTYDKRRLLDTLPKNATYIRSCFAAHWRLKLQLDTNKTTQISSEPLWRNPRFNLNCSKKDQAFFSALGVKQLRDLLEPGVWRPRTDGEWRPFLRKAGVRDETRWHGHQAAFAANQLGAAPRVTRVVDERAAQLRRLVQSIPNTVMLPLMQQPQRSTPEIGSPTVLLKAGKPEKYGIVFMF